MQLENNNIDPAYDIDSLFPSYFLFYVVWSNLAQFKLQYTETEVEVEGVKEIQKTYGNLDTADEVTLTVDESDNAPTGINSTLISTLVSYTLSDLI